MIANQKNASAAQNDETDTGARCHAFRVSLCYGARLLIPVLVCLVTHPWRTISFPRTVDAFIALGGNADKTGQVSAEKLRLIVKEFGLTIDIERLIREVDTDHSGFIDYQEFAVMMKS